MLCRRVIPCLDVAAGRVVKGTNFVQLRDAGDPVELAMLYDAQGADELVFLDITASSDDRAPLLDVLARTAERCFMPLTAGGGVRSVDDMRAMLRAGADKVSLNTAALARPELITECARAFGAQCVVVAVDARRVPGANSEEPRWEIFTHGGRRPTGRDAIAWAAEAAERGAGEILLTSMDADGTNAGYDLELTARVSERVPVPVIASGGAGNLAHLADALLTGKADAVLAAGIFHFGRHTVVEAKAFLRERGVPVRME